MFGIVLWTNAKTGDALIWCEDHQDLAYLDNAALEASNSPYVQVDDQIMFELDANSSVRKISRIVNSWPRAHHHSLAEVLQREPVLRAG